MFCSADRKASRECGHQSEWPSGDGRLQRVPEHDNKRERELTLDNTPFVIEQWTEQHLRWAEFVECLKQVAPEQAPFVLGDYSKDLPCQLFVALQNDQVVGFLRFGIQPIGSETGCPPLVLDINPVTEAKIYAFVVCEECRCQGTSTALQKCAIQVSRELGCYQLTSHSSYERPANCHVKLSLGFCAQPAGDGKSIYFLMPLKAVKDQ